MKKVSQETREKISNSLKGHPVSDETRKKIQMARQFQIISKETRNKMSEAGKGNKHALGYHHTEETKQKIGIASIGRQKTPDGILRIRTSQLGRHWKHTPRAIERIRQASKTRTHIVTEEAKQKMSIVAKERWKNPDYFRKMFKLWRVRPNKLEMSFQELLNTSFPNEWRYVGNGELILGGKCPDFLNINGKKNLIELYGKYWHKKDNSKERIEHFKKYGYSTLIIWENELRDKEKLIKKIANLK